MTSKVEISKLFSASDEWGLFHKYQILDGKSVRPAVNFSTSWQDARVLTALVDSLAQSQGQGEVEPKVMEDSETNESKPAKSYVPVAGIETDGTITVSGTAGAVDAAAVPSDSSALTQVSKRMCVENLQCVKSIWWPREICTKLCYSRRRTARFVSSRRENARGGGQRMSCTNGCD